MPVYEEKTLIRTGDVKGNEIIHYPITLPECIKNLDDYIKSAEVSIPDNSISLDMLDSDVTDNFIKNTSSTVQTSHIKDSAVTTAKINNSAVTEAKISTSAVTNTKLGSLSVSTAKIQDGAITSAKLSSDINFTSTKYATFVIGTSTNRHTSSDCDYLCDGVADNVQINNAIAALPSTGGKILILEGTYNLSEEILIDKDNVTLEGMGSNTIIDRGDLGTMVHQTKCIFVSSSKCCCVTNLLCSGGNHGIYVYNSYNCIVTKNYAKNCAQGIYFTLTTNSIMTQNFSYDNEAYDIFVTGTSKYNVVTGNHAGTLFSYDSTSVITNNIVTTLTLP